eukprot:TRINITY_DN34767_c0_g1_i2.p1 TRINITY_DN34767_c0_g1~~TRINITY_DN34767_c0_g1_i2.p1  ORF type:complete len:334 (-),score=60.35 TRINITY_DN34767_c0_g1_i2:97-1098(-)
MMRKAPSKFTIGAWVSKQRMSPARKEAVRQHILFQANEYQRIHPLQHQTEPAQPSPPATPPRVDPSEPAPRRSTRPRKVNPNCIISSKSPFLGCVWNFTEADLKGELKRKKYYRKCSLIKDGKTHIIQDGTMLDTISRKQGLVAEIGKIPSSNAPTIKVFLVGQHHDVPSQIKNTDILTIHNPAVLHTQPADEHWTALTQAATVATTKAPRTPRSAPSPATTSRKRAAEPTGDSMQQMVTTVMGLSDQIQAMRQELTEVTKTVDGFKGDISRLEMIADHDVDMMMAFHSHERPRAEVYESNGEDEEEEPVLQPVMRRRSRAAGNRRSKHIRRN